MPGSVKQDDEKADSPVVSQDSAGKLDALEVSQPHSNSMPQALKRSTIERVRLRTPQAPFSHPRGGDKSLTDVLVDFDGKGDPYHPQNWSDRKKLMSVITYGVLAAGATLNSAIFSAVDRQVASDFNVSNTVTALGTTLILLGFGTGPLLWGPLSEVYGRKYTVGVPYLIAAIFAFACGAAANIQTILITRFFQGVFSGAIITNTGGALSDIYAPKDRGTALIIYSSTVVCSPLLAPIIGSAIGTSYLRWRWTMYIVGIFQISIGTIALAILDESYVPVLLVNKARQLRYATGNWALHAKHEEQPLTLREITTKYLTRPARLLFDPMCFLMSTYASFVYGLIYGSLSAIPIVFEDRRGWSPVVGSLPFIALLLGCLIGLYFNTYNQKPYLQAMAKNDGKPVPEARLYPMMIGGFLLTSGLFIFGWTGDQDVIWVVPCIGIALIGIGFFPIFQASLNYIIDTYLPVAASAVTTVSFMRSVFAAAFPLFIRPMLNNLGIAWGLSLLGFIGVVMLPVPFLFYVFGKRARAHSKYAASA